MKTITEADCIGIDRDGERVYQVDEFHVIGCNNAAHANRAMATHGWSPYRLTEYTANFGPIKPLS